MKSIRVAQFGTFEVENYGDRLFPILLEKELRLRLPSFEHQLFSPLSREGTVQSIFRPDGSLTPCTAEVICIGGGDLISFGTEIVLDYDRQWHQAIGAHSACWAIPSIHWAKNGLLIWNAPGVPFPFTPQQAVLVRALAAKADYLSVRDEHSRDFLRQAGVQGNIEVVPDTALMMPKHFSREHLRPIAERLLTPFQLSPGEPLVFQSLNNLRLPVPKITKILTKLSQILQRPILLLPIGYCHNDAKILAEIQRESGGRFHFISHKLEFVETAALIAHAGCFLGSSLHGNITAFAYSIPHLIYQVVELKKLEGFAKNIQEEERLILNEDEILKKSTLLSEVPSRTVYQELVQRIEIHFDRISQLILHPPQTSARKNPIDLAEKYLELLYDPQTPSEVKGGGFEPKKAIFNSLFFNKLKCHTYSFRTKRLWPIQFVYSLLKISARNWRKLLKLAFKHLYILFETDPIKILPLDQWHLTLHAKGDAAAFLNRIQEELRSFPKQPDLTLVFSSFRVETNQLKETIDSLTKQYYSHWELRIPDEWKLNSEIQKFIDQICKTEPRIKWGRQDFTRADPYVVLLDPGDSLLPDALFEFVRHLNYFPDTDFIYSDENRISSNGSYLEPFYKPGWCPDSFLSRNYIGSLALVKREIAIQAGKLNPHFSAAQLYDFYLRVTELTNRISHIPKILYNRKNCNNEGASGVQALREALIRRRENGRVDLNRSQTACYTIRYTPAEPHEISILIPTKDQTSILKKCIDSIYSKTTYPNFELIVVSNNSNDPTLFSLLKAYQATHGSRFRFYENNIPFNFSKLMNEAASQASGKSLLFLNNDIEVISPDWIQEMAGQAERSSVGAVGCKLLYFNETIQHAGIIMGMKNNLVSHKFLGADRNDSCYFNQLNTVNNYSAVTAACLMCNKERFHEVNGFDESLQISFNDVDFCLKLREKGYHNVYLPHVELYHHESLTRGSVSATPDSLERFTIELDIMRERWSRYLIQDPCHSKHLNFL